MPKKTIDFPEQINILAPAGITEKLIAIAYYRGQAGAYAGPARDFLARGIDQFIEGLSDKDRKRFNEILANVRITRQNL